MRAAPRSSSLASVVAPFLVAFVGLGAGCDKPAPEEKPASAETESPKDSPVQYKVLHDEQVNGTVNYDVLIADGTKHDDVEALLKWMYKHLHERHEDPPPGMNAAVYTSMAAYETPPRTPMATLIKKPNDLGPTFENKIPLEFGQQIDLALGDRKDAAFTHKLVIKRDDAAKTVALTFPYTEAGKDEWAPTLSFNQAMQAFTDTAQALFNNVPDLRQLDYSGVWKDNVVVHITLSRGDYTSLKLSEIDERIGQHHGRIFLQLQTGKEANLSPEKANAEGAKQNAALIAKEYKAMLAQLKGKATVSPALK